MVLSFREYIDVTVVKKNLRPMLQRLTEPIVICIQWRVTLVLPLLIEHGVICERLHITPTTLRRWEAKGAIPFHPLGPGRRYLEWEVEKALQSKHRFGPPLSPHVGIHVLRERVGPEPIYEWIDRGRKTLKRRMDEGCIPYYKIGQTYLFAPDEVADFLGIPLGSFPLPLLTAPSVAVPEPTVLDLDKSPGGAE